MVSIENLTVEFGVKPLFTDVNYVINRHDRIALVGKNGAGKSTMLKIILGIQQPTSGRVSKPKGLTMGYLPQVMVLADSMTVRQETEKAFASTIALEERLAEMNRELETRTDYESQSYADLIDNMTELNEQLTVIQSQNRDAEIERTLMGLGFERKDFDRPTKEFSGGWRMRIELAKILLQHPDVLLLDEPTNHLDIESIQWLEKFLAQSSSTVVLISHDRAFLDNVTNRTIEITCGTIHDYAVNYSKYVVLHADRVEQQRRAYENQQKQLQETRDFIERFRYQATKAIQVQSRIKWLEKQVPIEVDEVDNSHLNLKFPPAPRSGDFPVICQDVRKEYDHVVFDHVDFTIRRGEKVAFVGRNGEGKSTLVKCIMSQIPFDGILKVGHGVKIGYFAQNQAQLLDENLTVFDTIDRVAVGDIRTRIKDILGAFMFGGENIEKPVKVLSGGERSRLAMIRLLLEPVNLLILDEPTNHLDIPSKQVLKDAIQAFDGTVILVSHDRDFLDGLVEKVYEFGHGRVQEHLCGIYEYLQKKNMQSLQELERKTNPTDRSSLPRRENASADHSTGIVVGSKSVVDPKSAAQSIAASLTGNSNLTSVSQGNADSASGNGRSGAPLSFAEQKALKAQITKLEKQIKAIENKMEQLQAKIDSLEAQMATPEGSQNQQLYIDHAALKSELDDVSFEWLEASEQLENLQK